MPQSTRLPQPDPGRGRLRVVLTGATGYIASQLLPVFRQRYDLTLLDVRTTDRNGRAVEGAQVADLLDENLDAYRAHWGRTPWCTWATTAPRAPASPGRQGLPGRAPQRGHGGARLPRLPGGGPAAGGVASPTTPADWYEPAIHSRRIDGIGPQSLPKSDNYYGWAKIAYEALGFVYASGPSGAGWRWCRCGSGPPGSWRSTRGARAVQAQPGAYISVRDIQQLFVRSIETASIEDDFGVPFQIFYGVSNNTGLLEHRQRPPGDRLPPGGRLRDAVRAEAGAADRARQQRPGGHGLSAGG